MGAALIANVLPLSQSNAVFYYSPKDVEGGKDLENRGGPLVVENDVSLQSGLSISPSSQGVPETIMADGGSAFAVASSNPFGDLTPAKVSFKKYKVKRGDTLAKLAKKFNISEDTIRAANGNIRAVRVGATLTILPVSGILYNVKEGDVIEMIANKYNVDPNVIKRQNPEYQKMLVAGTGALLVPLEKIGKNASAQTAEKLPEIKNFFALPLAGLNYGELHANNAVDIGSKCNVSVRASAAGTVVEDSALKSDGSSGWNNGYGLFVLLEHANGVKTRYAHLNKALVKVGDSVSQGDEIGLSGNSGNAEGPTGCHVHFEVMGAKNPFATK